MERLYADDLVLIAETEELLWKSEGNGRRVLEWMLVRRRSCGVRWAKVRSSILENVVFGQRQTSNLEEGMDVFKIIDQDDDNNDDDI